MSQVNVAIAGVGSCASSLVQCVAMARSGQGGSLGVMFDHIGGYQVADLRFVACFDVDKAKVGLDLATAIQPPLTSATRYLGVDPTGVIVEAGPALDGIGGKLTDVVAVHADAETADLRQVTERLRESGADVLVCLLPTGATQAVRAYARAAAVAGVGFVNATPEPVAVDPELNRLFQERRAVLLGDDLRSHLGATTLHTAVIELFHSRRLEVRNTYQLNVGGNTDFLNLSDTQRAAGKRRSKRSALAAAGIDASDVSAGPNGFIKYLGDTKDCYIRVEAASVLGSPVTLDIRLQVEDSPNAAGVLLTALRLAKLAADQGEAGVIVAACPTLFKNPPQGASESQGLRLLRAYLRQPPDQE